MYINEEIKRIKKLTLEQLVDQASVSLEKIAGCINDLFVNGAPIFKNLKLDNISLVLEMCMLPVASDRKLSKREYDLFTKITNGSGLVRTIEEFHSILSNSNYGQMLEHVNIFLDEIGEHVLPIKNEYATMFLCICGIDGKISENEIDVIKAIYK